MSEPPSDPNQRKQDLLSCPRWILESLKNERNLRRELENTQLSSNTTNNNNSDYIQLKKDYDNILLQLQQKEDIINEMKEQKDNQKEAIKRLIQTKEEEYQTSEKERIEIQEKYKILEEKTNRMKEQLITLPQRAEQISILSSELENLKVKYNELQNTNKQKNMDDNNEIQNKIQKLQKDNKFKNEKLQELVIRCKNYQTELVKKDKKIHKLSHELQQLHTWIKQMQERKQKSDEAVRKLVEQKQMALTQKSEQIESLRNEILRMKSNKFDLAPNSTNITLDNSGRRSSLFTPNTAVPIGNTKKSSLSKSSTIEREPTITWEIFNPRRKTQVTSFEFCRKLAKVQLPHYSPKKLQNIPESIIPIVIGPAYIEKIFVESDFELLKRLCGLLEEDYAEESSSALIHLFEYCDPLLCIEIVKYITIQELERTIDVNTLFRGNSLASKIMSKYSRLTGTQYLVDTLQPIIESISSSTHFEMNPDKITENENIEENEKAVLSLTQEFFDAIINSFDKMPVQFRIISHFLGDVVSKKFPEKPYFGVVNFIFLRFFCVGIAAPSTFGIKCDNISNMITKRGMILVSKVLQCLANGAKLKETFMLSLNTWLDDTTPKLNDFFIKLTNEPSITDIKEFSPSNFIQSKEDSIKNLATILEKEKENVLPLIPQSLSKDIKGYICIDVCNILNGIKYYFSKNPPTTLNNKDSVLILFMQYLSIQDSLMASIVEKIDTTIDYRQKEPHVSAFLKIFSQIHPDKVTGLLKFWADIECDNTGSIEANSMTSRMITKYLQIFGINVGRILLETLVNRVISHNVFIEIDEDRMSEAQLRTRAEDASTLLQLCDEWKEEILLQIPKLPKEIWEIFSFLAVDKQQVIGPVFIWSILCPCLENPELFGLTKEQPSLKIRRTLAIISEVFMKMAKENLFYQSGGSTSELSLCLYNLNSFIRKATQPFCQELQNWASCHPKNALELEKIKPIPFPELIKDIALVYSYIENNYNSIISYIGHSTTKWPMNYNLFTLTKEILK